MTGRWQLIRFGPISFRWRWRSVLVCAALAGVATVLALLLLGTGTLAFGPSEVAAALFGRSENTMAERVVLSLRLPRALTACLVGSSLGLAGAIFQSISRNPLGSPDVIGFTTGAATGAIVQIVLFDAGAIGVSAASAVAGMSVAALVLLLSARGEGQGGHRLILVGIGVGAVLSGLNTVLLAMGDLDRAAAAQTWLAGSLNARGWSHVWPAAAGFAAILPVMLHQARRLALLEMGDEMASQLGVPPTRTRAVMVLTAVALTALATAAAGPIAFVALAGPQLARRLTGSPETPLLSGALAGALLLLGADLVSQRTASVINLPIGLATGLLGGGYLLWLVRQGSRS